MKKSFLLILLLLLNSSIFGQNINRVGTSSAQFLKISADARASALGEAFVSIPGEVSGLFWNPASIASIDRTSCAFSWSQLYVDISYNFIGIVHPLNSSDVIGASVIYLDSGNMEVTTLQDPQGTGRFYAWESYALGLSYSRFVTDRLRLGASVKYIREGAYHQHAQTFAFDIGSLLDTGVLGMRLGMSLSNLGGNMKLAGTGLDVTKQSNYENDEDLNSEIYYNTDYWPLPLIFRLGLSTDLVGKEGQLLNSDSNRLTLAADTYDPNDANLKSNIGMEYEWNNIFALRGGYRGISLEKDDYNSYVTSSYSIGAGLKYKLSIASFQIDYAYTDLKILGNTQEITLKLAF